MYIANLRINKYTFSVIRTNGVRSITLYTLIKGSTDGQIFTGYWNFQRNSL